MKTPDKNPKANAAKQKKQVLFLLDCSNRMRAKDGALSHFDEALNALLLLAHVALRVDDIQRAFDYMRANGFKVIDAAPRRGSRGTTVFFVHPKTTESARAARTSAITLSARPPTSMAVSPLGQPSRHRLQPGR